MKKIKTAGFYYNQEASALIQQAISAAQRCDRATAYGFLRKAKEENEGVLLSQTQQQIEALLFRCKKVNKI